MLLGEVARKQCPKQWVGRMGGRPNILKSFFSKIVNLGQFSYFRVSLQKSLPSSLGVVLFQPEKNSDPYKDLPNSPWRRQQNS